MPIELVQTLKGESGSTVELRSTFPNDRHPEDISPRYMGDGRTLILSGRGKVVTINTVETVSWTLEAIKGDADVVAGAEGSTADVAILKVTHEDLTVLLKVAEGWTTPTVLSTEDYGVLDRLKRSCARLIEKVKPDRPTSKEKASE